MEVPKTFTGAVTSPVRKPSKAKMPIVDSAALAPPLIENATKNIADKKILFKICHGDPLLMQKLSGVAL